MEKRCPSTMHMPMKVKECCAICEIERLKQELIKVQERPTPKPLVDKFREAWGEPSPMFDIDFILRKLAKIAEEHFREHKEEL